MMTIYIYMLVCDLCGAKFELDQHASEKDLTDLARKCGWDVDGKPQGHYCPACKVPVKLAKELEAVKP